MSRPQIAPKKQNYTSKPKYHISQLNNILVNSRGSVMHSRFRAYTIIESRFRKTRMRKSNGKYASITRLNTDAWYTSKKELKTLIGCSLGELGKILRDLENKGLILRDHEDKNGSYNKLKIYLLKDTPYFIHPNGIELEKITDFNNHTSSEYIKEKYGIDRTSKVPHLKLVKSTDLEGGVCSNSSTLINSREEELLRNYSSSRGNNEKNKKIFSVVKNECVETTQQNSPQQKSSLGDDFDASEEKMERDWEYDYSNTALPEPPEYAVADYGLAGGELDYGNIPPDTLKPIETTITSDYVLSDTTPKKLTSKQEKPKEKKPMSVPQTKLEPRQELNCQILKTFSTSIASELQQKLSIKPIAPNKIGLEFKQGLELSNDEKQRLRETIKLVYGNSVKMVLVKPDKPKMPTKEDTVKRSEPKVLTPVESKWEAVKSDIIDKVYLDMQEIMKIHLNQVEVVSLEGRKLKLQARYSTCDKMQQKQTLIEQMAAKHGVDIELKNTTDNDILYMPFVKPNLDFLEN